MRPGFVAFLTHNPALDIERIGRMQPSGLKIYLHRTSNDTWLALRAAAPSAYYVAVDVARSDPASLDDPRGDVETGVRELDARPAAVRRLMAKNEKLLATDSLDHWNRWVAYHVAFTERGHQLGANVAVGCINTGHPGIALFGDFVDQWPRLQPVDDALNAGDCWNVHNYWTADGPLACYPWTVGRQIRCPTTHSIFVGEYGYDQAVFAPAGTPNHGWQGRVTEDAFVQQVVEFHQLMQADPRVKGTAGFVLDFEDHTWQTWDMSPIVERLIARASECEVPHPLATMPRLVKPIASDRITQTFAQHKANNQLGGWGVDWSAVTGTPVVSAAEGIADRVEDQGASGYGKFVQVNHWWGFTRYAHLSVQSVVKGQRVAAGARVGLSGNTGNSTGGHLHFEVIPFNNHVWSYRVDPIPLIEGGAPVPIPPISGAPVAPTEQEKADARTRIAQVNYLEKVAVSKGYEWLGLEWAAGAYTLALVQKPATMAFYVMKVLTGQWDAANVAWAAL